MYMSRLGLLERLFPTALYVDVVRDGRDAARSFLEMPPGLVTESWAHPRDIAGFACQWRTEVRDAVALGRRLGPGRYLELRYERLAADPEAALRAVSEFAGLEFDPVMLTYPGTLDLAAKPHQARLAQPPTAGVRDWRAEMAPADVAAFEAIAGDTLAAAGYDVSDARPPGGAGPGPAGVVRGAVRRLARGGHGRRPLAALGPPPPPARLTSRPCDPGARRRSGPSGRRRARG